MIRYFNGLLRVLLGGLFLLSGAIKIYNIQIKSVANPQSESSYNVRFSHVPDQGPFAKDVLNYQFPPRFLNNFVAITVPWVEVLAGALLMFGVWKRANALVIALLLVVFLVAISQAVARHLNINCGCFGTVEGTKVGFWKLGEDFVMLAVAAWLVWRDRE